MPLGVCGGAMCMCSFGLTPSSLMITPENKTTTTMPMATIMDNIPMKNVLPFGMCKSPTNPMVMAATIAAFGVLTPMPCIPVIAGPWMPGSMKTMIGNKPALLQSSKLMCNWGGMIQITNPGTTNIMIN